MDNHRLFRVTGTSHRLLSLEEFLFDKTSLRANLLQSKDTLYVIHYHEEDKRLRVGSIETYPINDLEEDIKNVQEAENIYEIQALSFRTLVRYEYSTEDDLVAVYHKDDLLVRTFEYNNHIMTAHKVPDGLESFYVYDVYAPHGKVLKTPQTQDKSRTLNMVKGIQSLQTPYKERRCISLVRISTSLLS